MEWSIAVPAWLVVAVVTAVVLAVWMAVVVPVMAKVYDSLTDKWMARAVRREAQRVIDADIADVVLGRPVGSVSNMSERERVELGDEVAAALISQLRAGAAPLV